MSHYSCKKQLSLREQTEIESIIGPLRSNSQEPAPIISVFGHLWPISAFIGPRMWHWPGQMREIFLWSVQIWVTENSSRSGRITTRILSYLRYHDWLHHYNCSQRNQTSSIPEPDIHFMSAQFSVPIDQMPVARHVANRPRLRRAADQGLRGHFAHLKKV